MGASCTKRNQSTPEESVRQVEQLLGFSKLNSTYVDMVVRKYSHNQNITWLQYLDIAQKLGLPISLKEDNCPIQSLYTQLFANKIVSCQLIQVLGIMLSNGEARNKAALLFFVFDTKRTKMLYKQEVTQLFKQMSFCSTNIQDMLIQQYPDSSQRQWLKQYTQKCVSQSYFLRKDLLTMLEKNQNKYVTLEDFVKKLTKMQEGQLVTAAGYRKYSYDKYDQMLPRRVRFSATGAKQTTQQQVNQVIKDLFKGMDELPNYDSLAERMNFDFYEYLK